MFTIKDVVYSLFGNYANSAKIKLISQKEFINGTSNEVSYISGKNAKNYREAATKLGKKASKLFQTTFTSRSEIYSAINIVKYLDITQQIIETVINDAFYSFDAEESFEIKYIGESYPEDEVNKRIERTVQRLKLYKVFRDILEDCVIYGEKYLETPCKNGVGIIEVNDRIDAEKVISIYDDYELLYHVASRKNSAKNTEQVMIEKDNLSHFIIDSKTIQVKSGDFDNLSEVPETIRIGKSILLPVLKLLQRYNLIDIANVANDLKLALMPPILNLRIGEQTTPAQMMEAIKAYEEYFLEMGDALHGIDASKEISPSQILQLATQVKIMPSSDGRGGLQRENFSSDSNLNESQDRLEVRIKNTIGIPNNDEQKSRLDNLREKARYAKKLMDIQYGMGHSIAQLIMKDLKYQGILVDEDNIEVKFKAIQNPNVEENAEAIFHLASSARDVIRTYIETAEDIKGLRINPKGAKEFLDSLMAPYPQLADMLEEDPSYSEESESTEDLESAEFDSDFDEPETLGDEIEPEYGDFSDEEPLIEEPMEEPMEEPEESNQEIQEI